MLMMNINGEEEHIKLKNLKPPILAGFGNPLLDICVNLKDDSFYTKFNVERDGQAEINSSDLKKFIDYVKAEKYDLKYCIGGSAQNTLRVFQWIIKYPQYSVFYGAVGDDENEKLLEKEVNEAGVSTRYKKHANHSTGTCIAFINGQDRYLVAHLGAANVYSLSDFDQGQNLDIFSSLHLCYIEGFFISHSFTTAIEIIKLCKLNGIVVAFNLSGVYLFKDYYKEMLYMVKVSDIVIGNKLEYEEFWKFYGGSNRTLKEILLRVHFNIVSLRESGSCGEKTPKLPFFERNKIVICTNGPNSVLCVHRFNNCMEIKPKLIEHSLIKDTTGAGDAFAAGFFAGILKGFLLKDCIELGCQIAGEIIKTIGCTLPTTNNIVHLE